MVTDVAPFACLLAACVVLQEGEPVPEVPVVKFGGGVDPVQCAAASSFDFQVHIADKHKTLHDWLYRFQSS